MAVAHDGEANQTGTVAAGTSLTISSKTTAGSNRCGIVCVAWNTDAANVTGVTWNGVAMTHVATATESAGAGQESTIYSIVNPPTSASDIVVSFNTTAAAYAVASSYNGVDQTTPISNSTTTNTSTATASPVTVTCTTASDEIVVDAVAWTQSDTVAPSVGANQTTLLNQLYDSFFFALASRQAGADGGVMSWTFTGTAHWATAAASLKAAASGSSSVSPSVSPSVSASVSPTPSSSVSASASSSASSSVSASASPSSPALTIVSRTVLDFYDD